jgi:protoporphyrinogen IX oxidase
MMIDPWIKALHVVAVMSWMAGQLYLPRLMVYHVDAERGSVQSETFKVMERRLLKAIMTPAMLVAWITGLWLAYHQFGFQGRWLHAKLLMVLLMTVSHGTQARWVKEFATDANIRPAKFYRMMNEVPTVLMLLIVVLVIVKPF